MNQIESHDVSVGPATCRALSASGDVCIILSIIEARNSRRLS